MNRQQRRSASRQIEHAARTAERLEKKTGGVLVSRDELEALHEMQRYFVAIMRDQGRVRVSGATLEALAPGDRVTKKPIGDGGYMLTFVAGDPPQEGAAT